MRSPLGRLVLCIALILLSAGAVRASGPQRVPDGVAPLKATQMRMLMEEPLRERREFSERVKELRRYARQLKSGRHTSMRARGNRARFADGDEDALLPAAVRPARTAAPLGARSVRALAVNVRCNDTSGDLPNPATSFEGQCETAIARWNNTMLAAWNDGRGFDDGTFQTQGWATSVDGGRTWLDRGTFPIPEEYPGWVWSSDPVLAVNPTTGAFYFAALGQVPHQQSSVGVIHGRFTGNAFTWDNPSLPRLAPIQTDFMDKEWLTVDPADGRVFLTYSYFVPHSDEIDCQWADSALAVWSDVHEISLPSERSRVQGSRPAVGPDGTMYVVYYLVGPTDLDYFRIARSTDRGDSFTPPVTAASFYANYGTGAPGFNRTPGVQFPSIAVDRSGHSHNGRVHLAWNESLDWYDDFAGIGTLGVTAEVEPNDISADANKVLVGQTVHGTCWSVGETDWYSLTLNAGQTLMAAVDSLENGQAITLRLYAPDRATRLGYVQALNTQIVPGYAPPTFIFTAPTTATYFLRVVDVRSFGNYRFRLGFATQGIERGRDQRDVFTSHSDDRGDTWSAPVRVNHDGPGYDEWLPEIAMSPSGEVACAWYDWRDGAAASAGGESSIYLATSADGGSTWTERGAVTEARTNWTYVGTNIVPNQGDYFSLHADAQGWALAWADGRGGSPDTYMAAVPANPEALAAVDAAPRTLRLAADSGPVTSRARLSYELPQTGDVRLSVLDLQGRRIATLADGAHAAGPHTAAWALIDATGERVGAGIYWAVLEADGKRASARMIVLR